MGRPLVAEVALDLAAVEQRAPVPQEHHVRVDIEAAILIECDEPEEIGLRRRTGAVIEIQPALQRRSASLALRVERAHVNEGPQWLYEGIVLNARVPVFGV